MLLECMNYGLGVAAGCVPMARALQSGPQIGVIKDFAVVDDKFAFGLIAHRLMAAGEVDNAQTPMAEGRMGVNVVAVIVRTAMRNGFGHAPQHGFGIRQRLNGGETGDPAHNSPV